MNFRILILFSFVLLSQSHAQEKDFTITGTVQGAKGSITMLLPMIWVEIENYKEIPTDSLGRFKFEKLQAGEYKIKIKSILYDHFDTLVILEENLNVNLNIKLKSEYDISTEIAREDIKNGKLRLLLFGGTFIWGQNVFEEKYNIDYINYGCLPPNVDSMVNYNNVIFEYLDKKYGNLWRLEVRQDVVGFKNEVEQD